MPAPLALLCLAAHYVGTVVETPAGWALRLPDQSDLVWDDGRIKAFAGALAAPDLQDTLMQSYQPGPIVPVTVPDQDPGRIRSDALLAATYGGSAEAVALQSVLFLGQTVRVHPRAAQALSRVSSTLDGHMDAATAAFVTGPLGGTFMWRPIANTTRRSAHSYGIAIDISVKGSDYWEWQKTTDGAVRWRNRVPQAIIDAFEAEGFIWGGRWYHYDTMHFEYRPELLDPACRVP
jgi:hypothetical protein